MPASPASKGGERKSIASQAQSGPLAIAVRKHVLATALVVAGWPHAADYTNPLARPPFANTLEQEGNT